MEKIRPLFQADNLLDLVFRDFARMFDAPERQRSGAFFLAGACDCAPGAASVLCIESTRILRDYGENAVLPMLTPDQAIGLLVLIGFVFSVVVHECAHAIVAAWCGDDTARLLGRITLNPLPHIDPIMSILFPATLLIASGGQYAFGGAKPVPVNFSRLRRPRRDMMLVALAGPASNVLLAICFTLSGNLLYLVGLWDVELMEALSRALGRIILTNMLLACFNLIPIPPLDGSRILAYFLPAEMAASLAQLERFGLVIVMLLSFMGVLDPVLLPAVTAKNWMLRNLIFVFPA
jgi:Zn-dependent protease